jgi:hypothetical protein
VLAVVGAVVAAVARAVVDAVAAAVAVGVVDAVAAADAVATVVDATTSVVAANAVSVGASIISSSASAAAASAMSSPVVPSHTPGICWNFVVPASVAFSFTKTLLAAALAAPVGGALSTAAGRRDRCEEAIADKR